MSDEEWAPRSAPSAPAQQSASARPSLVVAGYTDLVEVAQGGDSIVYHARQVSLDRAVAIKAMRISDPAMAERFRREVAITVQLGRQHPHIVTVLDTTIAESGELCLIMDFHDLGSLHDRLLAHGPLSVSEVVEAGTAVADALAFAHRAGVLHRDVKPQNILLLPTSFVLSDFGIARHTDADRTESLERFSYRHASPQVLDGLLPTESDDVWSLGSTLFTLLEGRAPFASDDPDDDTALAYLRRVRLNERRPQRRQDLPAALRDFIDRALAPAREERIATAEEALTVLRGIRTEGRSWQPDAAGAHSSPAPGPLKESGNPVPEPVEGPDHGRALRSEQADAADAASTAMGPPTDTAAHSSPPPAGPAPQARSALADLEQPALRHPTGTDDDATGTFREETTEPARADGKSKAPRGPWRRIVLFLAGMLLAGAVIGAAFTFLPRDTPNNGSTSPGPQPTSVPTASSTPIDDGTQPTVSNPDFAPRNLVVTDQGTSALLTWAPPTAEVTSIAVVRLADGHTPEVLASLSGSAEEFTVEGLDPDQPACFAVVGYGTKDGAVSAGSSPQSCTG